MIRSVSTSASVPFTACLCVPVFSGRLSLHGEEIAAADPSSHCPYCLLSGSRGQSSPAGQARSPRQLWSLGAGSAASEPHVRGRMTIEWERILQGQESWEDKCVSIPRTTWQYAPKVFRIYTFLSLATPILGLNPKERPRNNFYSCCACGDGQEAQEEAKVLGRALNGPIWATFPFRNQSLRPRTGQILATCPFLDLVDNISPTKTTKLKVREN